MKTNSTHKAVVLAALRDYRGDDLIRAKMAFKGLSAEEMASNYGSSGESRQTILDDYEDFDRNIVEATKWVNSL